MPLNGPEAGGAQQLEPEPQGRRGAGKGATHRTRRSRVARAGVGPGRGGPAWPGGAARDASGRGHAGPGAKTAGAGFIASASRAAGTERLVEKSFAESATLLCATLTGDPAEGGDRTGSGWRQKERSFRLL